MRMRIAAVLAALSAGMSASPLAFALAETAPPAKPSVNYWHLWTDARGRSHLTLCPMGSFLLQSMNKPADPQWQDRLSGSGRVIFTVQPAQWNGAWHEDPRVQWVVPLDGAWFVEAQDGKRVEMGPGVVFLGEDQNTVPDAQGRKGHVSGNVGDGAVALMVVQTDAKPTKDEPCHVK
jgi:hypothetical protein